jgi:hypothetical protein
VRVARLLAIGYRPRHLGVEPVDANCQLLFQQPTTDLRRSVERDVKNSHTEEGLTLVSGGG